MTGRYPHAMSYLWRVRSRAQSARSQWKMAGKYGSRRDLVSEALSGSWERFWLCRVQGKHQEKFATRGRCYRCGRAVR